MFSGFLASPARFERAAFRLGGGPSIQLRYGDVLSFLRPCNTQTFRRNFRVLRLSFALGGVCSILLSYVDIYEFIPYFQGFSPLRSGWPSSFSSKISLILLTKSRIFSLQSGNKQHAPLLDDSLFSLLFFRLPLSSNAQPLFQLIPEVSVDLPLRRRTLYPAELQKHLLFFPVFSRFLASQVRVPVL